MAHRDDLRAAIDVDGTPLSVLPLRLCEVAVERLAVEGAGVALISSPESRSLLSACGELAGQAEDLQFSLGEGPCLDAFNACSPALEPDLANGGRTRWPMFATAAVDLGIRAVFAFPLLAGSACFGVLDIARSQPGDLEGEQFIEALELADIATETVLRMQSDAAGDEVADDLGGVGSERIVVHQATGMVSAQAGIDIPAALSRLRAYAYADDRTLSDVARDVVMLTLSFEP